MTEVHGTFLEIEDLTKTYGSAVAVDNVNISVRRGEMLVLLGPSGCGKTTTLRLIAGFVEGSAGRILLEGKDYARLPPYRREMGMVFQSYALFPHMTIAQNIAFGLRMRRLAADEIRSRVDDMLDMVKLTPMANRLPRQLSGGQQQRVALARALAIDPSVLLLDEPLSNLDANLRQSVAREIRQLQRARGLTALMVTHDQEEAMTMADRLVVMRDGRVQQIGTQEELYEQPANPFVASFIGHSNLISGELVGGDRLQLPDGTEIRLAARYQSRGRHTLAIRPERIQLRMSIDPAGTGANVVVKDATYVGSHVDYLLGIGAGTAISVHDLAGVHRNARQAAGATLSITWDAVNEHLFDEQDVPLRPDLARAPIKQAS